MVTVLKRLFEYGRSKQILNFNISTLLATLYFGESRVKWEVSVKIELLQLCFEFITFLIQKCNEKYIDYGSSIGYNLTINREKTKVKGDKNGQND